ncbi:MAG: tetraacyldisaccharide 4'-kinase, partial [Desulfobacterales bacterium]|nr:tetraacyldisaccharide 4'-kinase [Desulfobacterales bacterium]
MTTDRLLERFEAKMTDPGPDRWLSVESALGAAAAVYGGAMALRAECYRRGVFASHRCSCPVVSVGNLTIGGTGKTPMVVYLARRLVAAGKRPAVVSRGYRGASETTGGIVSDTSRILLPAEAAGDEPWLIANLLKGVPVVVGKDRCRAARIAQRAFSPDVILMDDGFQHLRMRRSLDLLLLDAAHPFGNGRIFPRGTLREPI